MFDWTYPFPNCEEKTKADFRRPIPLPPLSEGKGGTAARHATTNLAKAKARLGDRKAVGLLPTRSTLLHSGRRRHSTQLLFQARLAQVGGDALLVQIELAGTVVQMGLALDAHLQRELRVKS